jgi:hypothetical protein
MPLSFDRYYNYTIVVSNFISSKEIFINIIDVFVYSQRLLGATKNEETRLTKEPGVSSVAVITYLIRLLNYL